MRMKSYGTSDVGRRRTLNEDSFLSDDGLGIYIVADGVGGHAKGEIASAQAVEEVHGYLSRAYNVVERFAKTPSPQHQFSARRLVESAVQSACYMVFGLAELDPEHRGMSTTMSALLLCNTTGFLAQVGDSRVYRLRDRDVVQLTEDHTLVNYKVKRGLLTPEEAKKAPGQNVITRAVGHKDYVQVDTTECDAVAGDRFMLCSDGLHTYVKIEELHELLPGEIETAAQRLVDVANERGGRDNITVIVVDILGD